MSKKIVLLIFVCVLIVLGSWIGYKIYAAGKLNDEAKVYIDTTVPKILNHWDFDTFYQAIDPSSFNEEDVKKWFVFFKKSLGDMKTYQGSEGGITLRLSSDGDSILAKYFVKAEFEKGPAVIRVDAEQNGDHWKIVTFFVDSKNAIPQP